MQFLGKSFYKEQLQAGEGKAATTRSNQQCRDRPSHNQTRLGAVTDSQQIETRTRPEARESQSLNQYEGCEAGARCQTSACS